MLLGEERPTDAGLHTHQQTISGLPDASRVPVAKHPRFGRYFWALFEAVVGRDLITSFDRPRAEIVASADAGCGEYDRNYPKKPYLRFHVLRGLLCVQFDPRYHANPNRTSEKIKTRGSIRIWLRANKSTPQATTAVAN